MNKKLKESFKVQLAQIEYWQRKIQALAFAIDGLREDRSSRNNTVEDVSQELYRKLADAYTRLTTLGLFDQELIEDARKMAKEQYFEKSTYIAAYLRMPWQPTGLTEKEDQEFRDEIKNSHQTPDR